MDRDLDHDAPRRHLISIGRLLLLFELYLGIAAGIALDAPHNFFAPPVLIFFQLDYGIELSLLVVAVCTWELFVYRTTAAIATFIASVLLACVPLWVWLWRAAAR